MPGEGGGEGLPRTFSGSHIRVETVSKRSCVLLPRSFHLTSERFLTGILILWENEPCQSAPWRWV